MQLYSIFQQHPFICTDSRVCTQGALFFALKGDNFNANAFAFKALENGCAYAIIDEPEYATDERFIVVDNVLDSLQQLAKFHRKQLNTTILGITGTNGKTTTKELIASVLGVKYNILYTKGNLNNHIGVPLTLLQLKPEHEIAIIEMGANHPGEIKTLVEIACPDYGIITNVGKAHLEGFGSFEGVMNTKAELYDFIAANGKLIFINSENELLKKMAEKSGLNNSGDRIEYCLTENDSTASVTGKITNGSPFLNMQCSTEKGTVFDANTKLIGIYNAENILAAASIGNFFGLTNTEIKKGLEDYQPTNNRSQFIETLENKLVVDTYNANPTSMKAAIQNFALINAENKTLILGDMLELGNYSPVEHQSIVDLIKEMKFESVYLVGKEFKQTENNFKSFEALTEAINFLNLHPIKNNYILIKGSRGIQLEKVIGIL
jgi:UDP-N-acetylmuramoyl-tripeptide--D-alanyl-D-alanine ligase